jgi:hypothetical protein
MESEGRMTEFDYDRRARLVYDRYKWLAALSGGAIVFLTGFLDTLTAYTLSHDLLTLALIGLAFTLFIAVGMQIVASAADRWMGQESVSPALLVWEWRLGVLAHLSFLVSVLLLVSFVVNNLRSFVP